MNIDEFINQTESVLYNRGSHCDFGCSKSVIPEMIEYIKQHLPDYQYCVVSGWCWIDIVAPSKTIENLNERGLQPSALFAQNVDQDEKNRGFKCVRTTFLKSFHKNCIFVTKNTAYILCQRGTRTTIDAQVFVSILLV